VGADGVWGSGGGGDGDNIVCGTSGGDDGEGDNIVWGTSSTEGDNIVWGTDGDEEGDNIVWGTSTTGSVTWTTPIDPVADFERLFDPPLSVTTSTNLSTTGAR